MLPPTVICMEQALAPEGEAGSSPVMWPVEVMIRSPATAYGPQRETVVLMTVGGGGGRARLRFSRSRKNPAASNAINSQVPRFLFSAAMFTLLRSS